MSELKVTTAGARCATETNLRAGATRFTAARLMVTGSLCWRRRAPCGTFLTSISRPSTTTSLVLTGNSFSRQVSVFTPRVLDVSLQQSGFFPRVSVFILHSTLGAHTFFEQLVTLALRRLLPDVLGLRVGSLENRFVRFRTVEQQLSRLRARRALQIHPAASNVVAYRSRAALRWLLHGFLLEPKW